MNTLEKLEKYRLHLQAWRDARKEGYKNVPEPKPESFSLYTEQEKFMAQQVRRQELTNE